MAFGNRGQAAVEMAVVMPVLLVVVAVSINMMTFLGDCARFDRVAAEAVRTRAASPGFGEYGSGHRADAVRSELESSFVKSDHLSFSVTVAEESAASLGSGKTPDDSTSTGSDIAFSLIPYKEIYECKLYYCPWGFGNIFFKTEFKGIEHKRTYVVDPYRPGVMF